MAESERIGGAALIAAAAGSVLAMSHHPSGLQAGGLGPIVHGAMLVFLGLTAFGFAAFAAARGPAKPAILAGAVCYALALFGHAGAATINGFVVPALAEHGTGAIGRDMFLFAWESNQALAKLGVIANGLALLFWSADFLGRYGREARAIGAAGLVAGAAPPLLLLTGAIDMNVAGAFLAYALQGAWSAVLGIHLIRGKASARDGTPAPVR
jgi:hypothetical protein